MPPSVNNVTHQSQLSANTLDLPLDHNCMLAYLYVPRCAFTLCYCGKQLG